MYDRWMSLLGWVGIAVLVAVLALVSATEDYGLRLTDKSAGTVAGLVHPLP